MTPMFSTYENLLKLHTDLIEHQGKSVPIIELYIYYCIHNGEIITQKQIQNDMKWSYDRVISCTQLLKDAGAIEVTKHKHNKKLYNVCDLLYSIPRFLVSSSSSTSNIYTSKTRRLEDESKGMKKVEEIENDEDWKAIEAILLKYFHKHQIKPVFLKNGHLWDRLYNLYSEEGFDFDGYCKWYRVNKYPMKKFHYGLLLYDGMVSEYKDALLDEEEDSRYIHTDTMNNSDSFKKSLKKKKKMYEDMGLNEEGDD